MDKQDKTAEEILKKHIVYHLHGDFPDFQEGRIIEAMEEYAQHRTAELEAKIKALKEAADEVIQCTVDPNRIGTPARLALEKYQSLKK